MKHFDKIERFRKDVQIADKLGIDKHDDALIAYLQKKPRASQEELAGAVGLSQPSIGSRIRKLQERGVLQETYGVNFKVVDLFMAKVDVVAMDTKKVVEEFMHCPFFLNALVTSGRYNVTLLFVATDLRRLEGIVNTHLRNNELIKDVEMNAVISTAKDFVMPLNVDHTDKRQLNCRQDCRFCS